MQVLEVAGGNPLFVREARALAFIDGMPDDSALLPTFRRHRATWDSFIASSGGRHLLVAFPYEGGEMPGYLFRPDDSGTRLVMHDWFAEHLPAGGVTRSTP